MSRFNIVIPVDAQHQDRVEALAVEFGRIVRQRAEESATRAGRKEDGRPKGAPFGTVFLDGQPRVERA